MIVPLKKYRKRLKRIEYDFDCSVFNNQYITGDIDDAYLNDLQSRRSEAKKKKANQESGIIDLHNDEAVE